MAKIIEVSNVFKSYGKKKVLEKLSFSLDEGKFITLIGCNGAGKSTTLRVLAGVEEGESGSVKVFGDNPFSFNFLHRPDVFFIHEQIEFTNSLNLLEMVKVYRENFPKWNNQTFNELIKDRKFSLKKDFSDLSRGQKMQFLLMLGLAANPRLMLLDEITAVIDIEGQMYFLDRLKDYTHKGGTVVISTNILSELNDYTDHLLLLQETKLMVNERVEDLQKRFLILKKTEDDSVFSHVKSVKLRKDFDGNWLYIIPRELLDEDTRVLKFKIDYPPKLEDILVLYFQLKQEQSDEELVA